MKNQTIEELQQENQDLKNLITKMRDQLTLALEQIATDHQEKKRGEFHHRAFEQLCPMPDLSQLTILK